jgi:hypothetical protein
MNDTPPSDSITGAHQLARVQSLFERLRPVGTARDKAGNRQLFCDQYVGLLLLYFFNPTLTSLRALQQSTKLDTVQRWLDLKRHVSLGALSEAGRVFEPDLLRGVLAELAARVGPAALPEEREALRHLTAVDGTLLQVLPRLAHILWGDAGKLSAKLHLHFEVGRGIPVEGTVTPAASSEIAQLKGTLQAGRLYVTDRGYASYSLMADIIAKGSSFVTRLRADSIFRDAEEQSIDDDARHAGIERDAIVRLGADGQSGPKLPVRIVVVRPEPGVGRSDSPVILCTDRFDLSAELVVQAYRQRWQIELFFRWMKCILGCRHLISHDLDGITFQVYAALIASVLLSGATGRKPTKRTYEMFCHYFAGWATLEEVQRHIESLKENDTG